MSVSVRRVSRLSESFLVRVFVLRVIGISLWDWGRYLFSIVTRALSLKPESVGTNLPGTGSVAAANNDDCSLLALFAVGVSDMPLPPVTAHQLPGVERFNSQTQSSCLLLRCVPRFIA